MGDAYSDRLETLYRQAVDLGDQARSWFDGPGMAWRAGLPGDGQAAVAIESLATTGRLLGVMAWLLDPAQLAGDRCPPLPISEDGPDLPAGSPLAGKPGGAIAVAVRRLVRDAAALAAAFGGQAGDTPPAQPDVAFENLHPVDLPAQPDVGSVIEDPTPKREYFGLWRK
ncbi:MAG: DUF1465 family protein [Sandarakinorhabdus sp.]|nr:DUF1465 family protein [Sandarakinorhabdus sp.]